MDGRPIPRAPQRRVYIALNKPRGVTCTVSDPHAQSRVVDLVDLPGKHALKPVGRLDANSEGLIFLTDDGNFIYKLTHPKHHVPKTYLATVRATPSEDGLALLRTGVRLDDGEIATADRVYLVKAFPDNDTADIELVLHEGKKRQVRRMFDAIGHPVLRLVRTRIGAVTLGGLPAGAWRHLTASEVGKFSLPVDDASGKATADNARVSGPERQAAGNRTNYRQKSSSRSFRPKRTQKGNLNNG